MRLILGLVLVTLAVTFCEARSTKQRSRREEDLELEIDHVTKRKAAAAQAAVRSVRDIQKVVAAKRKRSPADDTPQELIKRAKVLRDALAESAAKREGVEMDLAAKIRSRSRSAAKRARLQRGIEMKEKREQQNKARRAQHELNIKRGLAEMKVRMTDMQVKRKRALDSARAVRAAARK